MSDPNKPNGCLFNVFGEKGKNDTERLIIPITKEDKKRDREWIMKYIKERASMRKDYIEALNEYEGNK